LARRLRRRSNCFGCGFYLQQQIKAIYFKTTNLKQTFNSFSKHSPTVGFNIQNHYVHFPFLYHATQTIHKARQCLWRFPIIKHGRLQFNYPRLNSFFNISYSNSFFSTLAKIHFSTSLSLIHFQYPCNNLFCNTIAIIHFFQHPAKFIFQHLFQ